MRGGAYGLAAPLGAWPAIGAGVKDTTAMVDASASVKVTNRCRMLAPPLAGQRLLAPFAVEQLFHELDAFEIHDLRVLLLAAVERHAHLPGSREDFRILDRRFVPDHIGAGARVALDDVHRLAVEVPGPIEPALIVESGHVDDESVLVPPGDGLSHPRVDRSRSRILEIDVAHRAVIL